MSEAVKKGAMAIAVGNNPIGTHVRHECFNRHKTIKRRSDQDYKCQRCLEIRFNEKYVAPENQEFLPLKHLDKLIPDSEESLPLKEDGKLI